jgi:hypothetical protein
MLMLNADEGLIHTADYKCYVSDWIEGIAGLCFAGTHPEVTVSKLPSLDIRAVYGPSRYRQLQ